VISNTTCRVDYTGNGAQIDFPTTYRFLDESHLTVEVKPSGGAFATKVLGVDYTVTGEDEDAGGTVTFGTAPAASSTVRISRNTPRTQETTFRNNGQSTFSPVLHERAFDKLTMIAQEQARDLADVDAGVTPVELESQVIDLELTTQEPIESTFPQVVPCSGVPVWVGLGRIENLSLPGEVLPAEGLLWRSPVDGSFTVTHIEGLSPGYDYRATFLVLTA
jgi:hypothetical protein